MESSTKASDLSVGFVVLTEKAEKTPYLSAALHTGTGVLWGTAHPQNAFFGSEQSFLKCFKNKLNLKKELDLQKSCKEQYRKFLCILHPASLSVNILMLV